MALRTAGSAKADAQPIRVIDTDVHPVPRSSGELREYLDSPWREMPDEVITGRVQYYPQPTQGARLDALPEDASPAGSDPQMMRRQLFGDAAVDLAVLVPVFPYRNPFLDVALAGATNRWLAETWLSDYNDDGRFLGSLNLSIVDPEWSALEIEKWADDSRFVQYRVNSYTPAPLGDARYYPLYKAAQESGKPIAMHFARGDKLTVASPVGYPTSYFEHHALFPAAYAAHIVSLVFEGTLSKFDNLRFVFLEGGFAWIVPLLARMDRAWQELRSEVPFLTRPPSELVRERIRFSSQPVEDTDTARDLRFAFDQGHASEMLMFSSDYPHWDFDDPDVILRKLSPAIREKVAWRNAQECYGLPSE